MLIPSHHALLQFLIEDNAYNPNRSFEQRQLRTSHFQHLLNDLKHDPLLQKCLVVENPNFDYYFSIRPFYVETPFVTTNTGRNFDPDLTIATDGNNLYPCRPLHKFQPDSIPVFIKQHSKKHFLSTRSAASHLLLLTGELVVVPGNAMAHFDNYEQIINRTKPGTGWFRQTELELDHHLLRPYVLFSPFGAPLNRLSRQSGL